MQDKDGEVGRTNSSFKMNKVVLHKKGKKKAKKNKIKRERKDELQTQDSPPAARLLHWRITTWKSGYSGRSKS